MITERRSRQSEWFFYETDTFIYLAQSLARHISCLLSALGIYAFEIGFVGKDALGFLTQRTERFDDGISDRGFQSAIALAVFPVTDE